MATFSDKELEYLLHKNTIRQPLAKIASTFALDLSDRDVRLGLALATSLRDAHGLTILPPSMDNPDLAREALSLG